MNISIESLGIRYNVNYISLSSWIESLEQCYLKLEKVLEKIDETNLPSDVIIPDKEYVKKIKKELSNIMTVLENYDYNKIVNGMETILKEGDFDDADEIINSVHELIKKHIYGSDTKVSADQWKKCEKYLEKVGYIPIDVKAGDNISNYKIYFDRPIPANGGLTNTIKQIQLKPYKLKFFDGEQIREELKLCGKCTYYK